MKKVNLKVGDKFRNTDEIFDDAVIFKITNLSEEKDGITCDVYQNEQYLYSQVFGLSETIKSLENGSFVFVNNITKGSINEILLTADATERSINVLQRENHERMVNAIIDIVNENGGKIEASEWEGVLNENCEITFVSNDGTYTNYHCEVEEISTFEMSDGTPNFTIKCSDTDDYPEYSMDYETVWSIFQTLTEWYLKKER